MKKTISVTAAALAALLALAGAGAGAQTAAPAAPVAAPASPSSPAASKAADPQRFDAHKQMTLSSLAKRIAKLQDEQNCVQAATTDAQLQACRAKPRRTH